MKWFPFYSSDFIGATVELSFLERAAYALMLVFYYETGGPFPLDRGRMYRAVGCESDAERQAVDYVLSKHFVQAADGWYQERAEKEKIRSVAISDSARRKSRRRWDAAVHDAPALLRQSPGNAGAMPPTPTPTPTPTEDHEAVTSHSVGSSPVVEKTTTGSVACPVQKILDLWRECLPGLPQPKVLTKQRRQKITERWRWLEPTNEAEGLDWLRAMFVNSIGQSRFLTGRAPPSGNRRPFKADLDFVFRSEQQFVEIYEGKYQQ